MVGRSLGSRFPDHTPTIGDTLFEVRDWTVQHPLAHDRLVCKGSSFKVRRGEIVGFAGLMGAGRTELAMSIFGRSYGQWISGTVYKDGKEIQLRSVSEAIAHGLAYVSEDRKVLGPEPARRHQARHRLGRPAEDLARPASWTRSRSTGWPRATGRACAPRRRP